jgi:hypothetical protein
MKWAEKSNFRSDSIRLDVPTTFAIIVRAGLAQELATDVSPARWTIESGCTLNRLASTCLISVMSTGDNSDSDKNGWDNGSSYLGKYVPCTSYPEDLSNSETMKPSCPNTPVIKTFIGGVV